MAFGGTFIFGHYSVTWNGAALGIMQGDQGVPTVVTRAQGRPITNTDKYADLELGHIYRGVRGRARMRCMEYAANVIAAIWPWGADGVLGVLARDTYSLSQALVLTATAGTPAAASPASLTASKTLLAPDFDISLMFGPVLREVGLEFLLYPYTDTNDKLFSKT